MSTEIVDVAVEQPSGDTPEYVQAMVDKAEGKTNDKTQTPKLLAGKYETEEALQKGILELAKKQAGGDLEAFYKSLESGLGDKKEDETPPDTEGETETGTEESPLEKIPESTEEVEEALEQRGLDFNKYSTEYTESGKLSDESYKELADKGIPKELVDAHIAGQEALATKSIDGVLELAGGKENYSEMVKWASQNLSDTQKKAFNDAVDSGNTESIKTQVLALKSLYTDANGSPPKNLIDGDLSSSTNTDVFRSMTELVQAQKDARYGKDRVYTQEILEKAMRSKKFL